MGYDAHITRRLEWTDAGNDIGADKWRELVERDPELKPAPELGEGYAEWTGASALERPWLQWERGGIQPKNPDEALLSKMTAIAEQLRANVQGDDGERYERGGLRPTPGPTLMQRLGGLFGRPAPAARQDVPAARPVELPFGVGDRMRDTWGHEYTVTAIDPAANHGLGEIRIRRDDGAERAHAVVAHGLERVG